MFLLASISNMLSQWVDFVGRHAQLGWWTLAISVVLSVGGIVAMRWLLVAMPADYFVRREPLSWEMRHPVIRWTLLIGKNLLGVVLLIVGAVLLIAPGPGVLTILVALVLLDIPGKRTLEAHVLALPAVLHTVNRIRQRANQPPLEMPQP